MSRCVFLPAILILFLLVPHQVEAQSGSFGNAVVLDQNELLVGEPNTMFREGSVYVYKQESGVWELVQRLTAPNAERADGFGTVLARTGNTVFVGQRN